MDVLGNALDDRFPAARGSRESCTDPNVDRLLNFDAWVRGQLEARLDWTWAGADRQKRIEQCRVAIEGMVVNLWRRGWMLDGKRLAAHIVKMLSAIAKYQKAGKVAEFWPYFNVTVKRYVGLNAEELQREAMSAGAHVSQALDAVLAGRRPLAGPTLPELVAQRAAEVATLRDKLAQVRAARKASRTVHAGQQQLL